MSSIENHLLQFRAYPNQKKRKNDIDHDTMIIEIDKLSYVVDKQNKKIRWLRLELEDIRCGLQIRLEKSDEMMESLNIDIEIGRKTSNDDNDPK